MKKFVESWKNEIIDDLKLSLKEVEQKDTIGIFKGIMETYDEFINDDNKFDGLEKIYKEQREDWTGELDDSNMMMMIFGDIVDREFIYYYSDILFYNLYNLDSYYNKDEECWISKYNEINNKMNYMLICDYYYSIDTDVRESIGDILDFEIIDYMKKWNL
jgi:hypothetical protein